MRAFFKILPVFLSLMPVLASARTVVSRAARVTNTPTSGYTYNYMYPYMNNQMRKTLNPGDANAQNTSPINAVVKTTALPDDNSNVAPRRVVSRSGRQTVSGQNSARSGVNQNATIARSGTGYVSTGSARVANRRVSPRGSVARATRANSTVIGNVNSSTSNSVYVSPNHCLADYVDCMNGYCERSDTAYNRCFCSSKLSQIESSYQSQIDSLIKQILTVKNTTTWTDTEMADYWNQAIGQYVGENSWENLDDALNIDWPGADDRLQGQNAYLAGHKYCVNHLANCAYVAPNMRDVYLSEISRDCASYEKSLGNLKTALETVLATYQN